MLMTINTTGQRGDVRQNCRTSTRGECPYTIGIMTNRPERLISADSHVQVPLAGGARAGPGQPPRAVRRRARRRRPGTRRSSGAARCSTSRSSSAAAFSEPGYWDPNERLKLMDADGVDAEVLYSEVERVPALRSDQGRLEADQPARSPTTCRSSRRSTRSGSSSRTRCRSSTSTTRCPRCCAWPTSARARSTCRTTRRSSGCPTTTSRTTTSSGPSSRRRASRSATTSGPSPTCSTCSGATRRRSPASSRRCRSCVWPR